MRAGEPFGVITIDGPAGAGKSTLARELATRVSGVVVETGVDYRTLGWLALDAGLEDDAPEHLLALVDRLGEGLAAGAALASEAVALRGSRIARVPEVRIAVRSVQRARIAAAAARSPVVVVGRDTGTVLIPDASLKLFVFASASERARRLAERTGMSLPSTPARDETERDLLEALAAYPDLHAIDTTHATPEVALEQVRDLLRARGWRL